MSDAAREGRVGGSLESRISAEDVPHIVALAAAGMAAMAAVSGGQPALAERILQAASKAFRVMPPRGRAVVGGLATQYVAAARRSTEFVMASGVTDADVATNARAQGWHVKGSA